MLTIRNQQMHLLGKVTGDGFAVTVAQYLRDCFPEELAEVSDRDLSDLVAHGMARAPRYGFTAEREVARYLMLMVFLGPDFDTDTTLSHWVSPLLEQSPQRHASFRMDELFERAVNALRASRTPNLTSPGSTHDG